MKTAYANSIWSKPSTKVCIGEQRSNSNLPLALILSNRIFIYCLSRDCLIVVLAGQVTGDWIFLRFFGLPKKTTEISVLPFEKATSSMSNRIHTGLAPILVGLLKSGPMITMIALRQTSAVRNHDK